MSVIFDLIDNFDKIQKSYGIVPNLVQLVTNHDILLKGFEMRNSSKDESKNIQNNTIRFLTILYQSAEMKSITVNKIIYSIFQKKIKVVPIIDIEIKLKTISEKYRRIINGNIPNGNTIYFELLRKESTLKVLKKQSKTLWKQIRNSTVEDREELRIKLNIKRNEIMEFKKNMKDEKNLPSDYDSDNHFKITLDGILFCIRIFTEQKYPTMYLPIEDLKEKNIVDPYLDKIASVHPETLPLIFDNWKYLKSKIGSGVNCLGIILRRSIYDTLYATYYNPIDIKALEIKGVNLDDESKRNTIYLLFFQEIIMHLEDAKNNGAQVLTNTPRYHEKLLKLFSDNPKIINFIKKTLDKSEEIRDDKSARTKELIKQIKYFEESSQ